MASSAASRNTSVRARRSWPSRRPRHGRATVVRAMAGNTAKEVEAKPTPHPGTGPAAATAEGAAAAAAPASNGNGAAATAHTAATARAAAAARTGAPVGERGPFPANGDAGIDADGA